MNVLIIGGARSGLVVAWKLGEQRPILRVRPHTQPVTALKVVGNHVITGSRDGFVAIFPLDSCEPQRAVNPGIRGITTLAVFNQKAIAGGGERGCGWFRNFQTRT